MRILKFDQDSAIILCVFAFRMISSSLYCNTFARSYQKCFCYVLTASFCLCCLLLDSFCLAMLLAAVMSHCVSCLKLVFFFMYRWYTFFTCWGTSCLLCGCCWFSKFSRQRTFQILVAGVACFALMW
ncbi:unnamed protein product [Ixodes pacificus]